MGYFSCLPAFSGRHTHRSGRNQKPVVLRSASAAPIAADRELKLAGSGRLRPKRAGPAVRIHLAPPSSRRNSGFLLKGKERVASGGSGAAHRHFSPPVFALFRESPDRARQLPHGRRIPLTGLTPAAHTAARAAGSNLLVSVRCSDDPRGYPSAEKKTRRQNLVRRRILRGRGTIFLRNSP
jgi:hypothetical protein